MCFKNTTCIQKNSWNNCLHSRKCLLEGKYLFWRLAALIKKTQRYLDFISNTVGVRYESFLTKQHFHSSNIEMSSFEQSEKYTNSVFCSRNALPGSSRCWRTIYDIKKRCVRVSINDFVKHRSIEDDCPTGCFFSSIEYENVGDIFSITSASFTTNIFLNAKLSIKNFTGYSWMTARCNQTKTTWKLTSNKRLISFTRQCSTLVL